MEGLQGEQPLGNVLYKQFVRRGVDLFDGGHEVVSLDQLGDGLLVVGLQQREQDLEQIALHVRVVHSVLEPCQDDRDHSAPRQSQAHRGRLLDDVQQGLHCLLETGLATKLIEDSDQVLDLALEMLVDASVVLSSPLEQTLEHIHIPYAVLQELHVHTEAIALPKKISCLWRRVGHGQEELQGKLLQEVDGAFLYEPHQRWNDACEGHLLVVAVVHLANIQHRTQDLVVNFLQMQR